jgi:hypothetical protein
MVRYWFNTGASMTTTPVDAFVDSGGAVPDCRPSALRHDTRQDTVADNANWPFAADLDAV